MKTFWWHNGNILNAEAYTYGGNKMDDKLPENGVHYKRLDFLYAGVLLDFLWICKPYIGPGFLVFWSSSGFLVDFLKPYIGVFSWSSCGFL